MLISCAFVSSGQPLRLWWFFVVFDLWRPIGVQFSLAGVSVLASVVPFGVWFVVLEAYGLR